MAFPEAGLVHLRAVVPDAAAESVIRALEGSEAVLSVIRIRGASIRPAGDLVLCDVAREEVSVVIERLRQLGVERDGSISIEPVHTVLAMGARRVSQAAAGAASDAVIWEEVEARTSESAELSFTQLAFMVLATLIAAIGILTDSVVLIIGAMVVGPEFGPLAGICVALVQRRLQLARRSGTALVVGFPVAIVATCLAVLVLRAVGTAPDAIEPGERPATLFISHPDAYSVLVALIAGVAGMLSLTTAKSSVLLGVLISVTTIPAAANIAVGTAYGDWHEVRGAAAQLVINLACIVVAGVATLWLQRRNYARRLRRAAAARELDAVHR